jgi:molybdopterin/thiamine biosynthesis adenylyltransferase
VINAELRIPGDLYDALHAYLTQSEEWAGYLLCGVLETPNRVVLLGREWCPIPEQFRIRGTRHGMTWHPNFDIEMLNRAQRERLGCVVIHHHGGGHPSLSDTDKTTCDSLLPFLSREAPIRPHAFVVTGTNTAAGPVYRGGHHMGDLSLTKVVGSSIQLHPKHAEVMKREQQIDARHDRLVRGFGRKALARLRAARVGVVGNGGGGSHVIQQLAYLGVGAFVLADADRIELSNLNRLIGALPPASRRGLLDRFLRRGLGDVGRPKVEVMARLIRQVSESASILPLFEQFPSAATIGALGDCDLIIACVDRLQVRDDLNRFCKRYLIPLIDVGLEIFPGDDSGSTVAAITGRVTKVQSDGPCLRCQGVIDDAKLERERGGRPPGYVGDPRLPDPAVVTLNGIVASIATSEALQILTGFAGEHSPNCGWMYDGLTGTVERVTKAFRACPACVAERGMGDA